MSNEAQLKRVVRIQYDINKHMMACLRDIQRRCESSIDYSKANGFTPSRAAEDIREKCIKELAWVDVQSSKASDAKLKRPPKDQILFNVDD